MIKRTKLSLGLREKVKANNPASKKKAVQKAFFKKTYDKPKEYKPKEKYSMIKYFNFPAIGKGFTMTLSEIAVYPVLCGMADFKDKDKWISLSREHIAIQAGISAPTVDNAINNLMQRIFLNDKTGEFLPFLERKQVIDGKRHFYKYKVNFVRGSMKKEFLYFPLHTAIIDSLVWKDLSARAQALYVGMRSQPDLFDEEFYCGIEQINLIDIGYETWQLDNLFKNRKWEMFSKSLQALCREIKISYSHIQQPLKELEDNGMIEQLTEHKCIRVFLQPKHVLKEAKKQEELLYYF